MEGKGGGPRDVQPRAHHEARITGRFSSDLRSRKLLFAILIASACMGETVGRKSHVPPPVPPWASDAWAKIIRQLYDRLQTSVGFCVGSDPNKIIDIVGLSYEWPPPTALGDPICGNNTRIAMHLCGPEEVELYFRFMQLTDDPEKVPTTSQCPPGTAWPACSPGFFALDLDQAHACCPGYFCPHQLSCMMPCPLGAFCPSPSTEALPPVPFRAGGVASMWCAPYAYRRRPGLGCGGADRWTLVPKAAFPGLTWDAGSGNLYCPASYYCPNTTSKMLCPQGRFCRQGSTTPERCPPGAVCGPGTEVPIANYGGAAADGALLLMLGVVWWLSAQRKRIIIRMWPFKPREARSVAQSSVADGEIFPEEEIRQTGEAGEAMHVNCEGGKGPRSEISMDKQLENEFCGPDTPLLEVQFSHLSFRLRSTRRIILSDVSASLQAARLTAIMGPSGAGKTTLLCALAGRAPYGSLCAGHIRVNGVIMGLERFRRAMGFVPQDDTMHTTLTVEENLLFAARLRLPSGTTRAEHRRVVQSVLAALELESVRSAVVGDEETRGISGGQRKRVNVGLELVARPRLLFLDEPTSGLDAAGAKALVSTLRRIVRRASVTATAVVHQPRHESFFLFDDLLLLAPGGRTAYYGPVSAVEGYFTRIGLPFPLHVNPADALLDIVASTPDGVAAHWKRCWGENNHVGEHSDDGMRIRVGTISDTGNDDTLVCQEILTEPLLPQLQNPRGRYDERGRRKESTSRLFQGRFPDHIWNYLAVKFFQIPTHPPEPHASPHAYEALANDDCTKAWLYSKLCQPPPGFATQFLYILHRAAIERSREPVAMLTDLAIIAAAGLTVGLLSDRGRDTIMNFAAQVSYSVVAISLMAMVGAVPTFARNSAVFRREAASGVNRVAYFLALDMFDAVGATLRSSVYLITWCSFSNPKAIIWQLFLVTTALYYACVGTGYALSLTLGSASAQLAAAVITLVATLVARQPAARGALALAQDLSPARWALEGFVIAESNRLTGVWLLARCADLAVLQYDVRRFFWCLWALVILGWVCRGVAVAVMMGRGRAGTL